MVNEIVPLPNGGFEVKWEEGGVFHSKVMKLVPYEFARDREIEEKIANDERERRKAEDSKGSKSETKQGSGKRDSHVASREW